jgi:Aspartyl protease
MKKIISKSLLLCFFAVTACAQNKSTITSKDVIEIPFTMDRNLILIKASINNEPENSYIFDTGTQGVVLNKTTASKYNLKGEGFTRTGSPNDTIGIEVRNIDIPMLSVNGFTAKNVKSIEVEDQGILTPNAVGIIGISLFKGKLITINYKESKLIIANGELKQSDKAVIKVNLSQVIESEIKVNQQLMAVYFDSGGPEAISFPLEWKNKLTLKSDPVLFAKGRTPSGEVEIYKSQLDGIILIGNIELKDPKITLVSGGFNGINIGFPFLKEYVTTIDMNNQLMKIIPN